MIQDDDPSEAGLLPPEPQAGFLLVARLWSRGVKREVLQLDNWLKEVAPSDALRRRFGHVTPAVV